MARTLEQILEEMQKLPTNQNTETVHMIADELLTEALKELATWHAPKPIYHQVLALISAYNQIEKWYA